MTVNSLFPGFVRIKYNSNGHDHYQVLPVAAEAPVPTAIPNFTLRNGSSVNMDEAVTLWITQIKTVFPASTNFILAEYWNIATPDADPVLYYSKTIGVVGTSAGAVVANSQGVLTMRTVGGGLLKIYLMELAAQPNTRDPYPFISPQVTAIASYLADEAQGWVVGRDTTFPFNPLNWTTKTNDVLRKKYLLGG